MQDFNLTALEREYVIDIDMTDYDNIRTCCQGKKLCEKCWIYIRAAYDVLKVILKETFGFKHILWVFSGRRGLHAWVCDHEAKIMSKKIRKSVTNFLNLTINSDKVDYLIKDTLINKRKEYPMVTTAYKILLKYKNFLINE